MHYENKIIYFVVSVAMFIFFEPEMKAQTNSFDVVYGIFQGNCISCYSSTTKQVQLDLSGGTSDVYKNILNVDVVIRLQKPKEITGCSGRSPQKFFLGKV